MTDTADAAATMTIPLHDGTSIPQLGLGVWQMDDETCATAVAAAIDAGYRHIDTARVYRNERGVGAGIRAAGIDRDQVFITTKLWNTDQGRDSVRTALDRSCERLGVDAVDLYLIHWPAPARDRYVETWEGMVDLLDEGRTRSIGVCNFEPEHLERIIDATGVVPVLNQVELHPYLQQRELRAVHERLGIVTEGYSPLGHGGELLTDPVLVEIAAEHGATPAQIVIRWHLQHGFVTIPKSQTPRRIIENISVRGFELDAEQMAAIDQLDRGASGRIGADPHLANFE